MVLQKTTRASKPPKTKSIFGFTLIELIVVITILAILGTIGFLSIWGYSSKARDSARIGDVAQISKSLDVSIITRDSYPTPDNSFSITYSGGILWNQGTIGNTVMQSLRTSISWGGLNKKPVDPLDNSEYVYSSLAFGKSYQIQAEYEGDLNQTTLSLPSITTTALAAPGTPTIAYVKGNYSWLMARTVTGSYTYILALPSIITSTGTTSGNKIEITTANALSGTLLFHGRTLRAASAFNPNLTPVFSGSGRVLTTNAEITTLMTNLKNTYANSGATDVKSNTNIANLLTLDTNSLTNLGSNLVKSELGIVGGNGGGGDTTTTSCSPGTYSATGNIPCTSASPGRYVSSTGATSPTITTAGYYTSSTGATTQTPCTAGYYCSAGSITPTQNQCPANNYCPAGSGSPTACTWGSVSPAGSTSVGACLTAVTLNSRVYTFVPVDYTTWYPDLSSGICSARWLRTVSSGVWGWGGAWYGGFNTSSASDPFYSCHPSPNATYYNSIPENGTVFVWCDINTWSSSMWTGSHYRWYSSTVYNRSQSPSTVWWISAMQAGTTQAYILCTP